MGLDYYDVLGLSPDATPEEIRAAYFEAARHLHPDTNPEPQSNELFIQINEAYEALSNPNRRAGYDAGLDASYFTAPAVAISLRTSRTRIQRVSEPQIVYALLEVVYTGETLRENIPTAHVCLVIDCSTSMQGQRMDMVKANVSQALKFLKPKDMISVVTFSDRAEVIIPPTLVSAFSKSENRLYQIQTGGGTEIYQGLSAGIDQLQLTPNPEMHRHLVLLTDGHTYGDETACLALAERASLEGMGISVLGIGSEWNDEFLDHLTSFSGGNTSYITSTKDLSHCLEQKMTGIDAVYARGVSLQYQSDPSVELQYAFRIYPEVSPVRVEFPLSLGDLQYGKSILVLMEFLVHPLPKKTESILLMDGVLKLRINESGLKRARLFVKAKCSVSEEAKAETPLPAILEALSRLTLYRMQDRARQDVMNGEIGPAVHRLQYLATHLLSRGQQDLAHTVLAEAEHIRQTQAFSKEGDKRIKYGTRSLLLPSGPEIRP